MKKTGKIICIVLIAILIIIMIISNRTDANTLNLSGVSSVDPGQTFSVRLDVSSEISNEFSYMQFSVNYDATKFEGIDQSSNGWNIKFDNESGVGYAIFVDNTADYSNPVSNCSFSFKVVDGATGSGYVKIVKDDTLKMIPRNATETLLSDNFNGNFEISININNSTPEPTPTPTDPTPTPTDPTPTPTEPTPTDPTPTPTDPTPTPTDPTPTPTEPTPTPTNPTPTPIPGDTDGPILSKSVLTIEVGNSETITSNKTVTWLSSDESIATVDKNGKITAISEGSAVIVAIDENGNRSYVAVSVTSKNTSTNVPSNSQTNSTNSGTSVSSGSSINSTNSSSSANQSVPATGESSIGLIAIIVIVTLLVASVIFRHKSKVK